MRRRDFVKGIIGGSVTWPLAALAQQPKAMRHIGVMMSTGAESTVAQARLAAFMQGLQEFGWAVGRNMRIEIRWPAGDAERTRREAAELVALAPDVILATGSATSLHYCRRPARCRSCS
jgi:DNA-binding LacI/PurR family transcriptional regulator